ncbi:MAG: HD domain-containing protein [Pseudomonadota bacterium]
MERIRDPIHGLIKFESKIDELAWSLIETPEFQRLRRIKQLGFSELTFPGATHNRFAHSVGVYANARKLLNVAEGYLGSGASQYDPDRADDILIASLLHDIGHGPFSHAFERAREVVAEQRDHGPIEKHEKYSAKIILDPNGQILPLLEDHRAGMATKVAAVISSDEPRDIYDAVISSSFDADRLDYLVRDRYMTGTGTGAIDVDWLMDNLDGFLLTTSQDGDEDTLTTPTFVFKTKGRQAAEDFLLARFRLYTEVYLHKTTRGFEVLLTRLIELIGSDDIDSSKLNLPIDDPLLRFMRGDISLSRYLHLDDFVVWNAIRLIAEGVHAEASTLAKRLLNRDHLYVLDLFSEFGHNDEVLLNVEYKLRNHAGAELGRSVFVDDPPINLYSSMQGESEKVHKIVRVLNGSGEAKEITDFPETIISKKLRKKRRLVRFYYPTREMRDEAAKLLRGR